MEQRLLLIKKAAAVGLMICLAAVTGRAQQVISLQTAIDRAMQYNLSIKQSTFNTAIDEATYQQSKNNRLPGLSSSISTSENFGRSVDLTTYQYTNRRVLAVSPGVSASMTLFQGGQLRSQILTNKLTIDYDKSNTEKLKNDMVLNVVVEYLQILTNLDLVAAAKQQIEIAKLTLDRTQKSVDAGNQTLSDLSQAKAGMSTAELNLTTAQNQADLSLLILKQYMELPASTEITVVRPDISKLTNIQTNFTETDILEQAIKVNPDVKLAEAQQAIYAQNIKTAKGTLYPTLSIFGGLSSNYSDAQKTHYEADPTTGLPVLVPYRFFGQLNDNFSQSIGLSLQIPIFNRFNARTNIKRATLVYQSASLTTQATKNNLTKIIYQAVLDAKASERQYQSSSQTYQANKDAFNVIEQRYNVGLENSLNYNTSLTNLNKSQNDMIQARYNMVFRSKVIDYYLGKPILL